MKFNDRVTIYVGDFKINPDSHQFLFEWEDRFLGTSFQLIRRIPVVDIDFLGLDSRAIKKIVHEASKEVILCTLYPTKVDTSLPCKITYKNNLSDPKDFQIWDLIKECFFEKDRFKLSEKLKNSNVSTHVLNMWLQSNPTPDNIGTLKVLDKKSLLSNPDLWIDILSLKLKDGPSYPRYKYKKKV